MSHLEKLKTAFSRLGVIAANYLPAGFKDSLLDMAQEIDTLKSEIAKLKGENNGN